MTVAEQTSDTETHSRSVNVVEGRHQGRETAIHTPQLEVIHNKKRRFVMSVVLPRMFLPAVSEDRRPRSVHRPLEVADSHDLVLSSDASTKACKSAALTGVTSQAVQSSNCSSLLSSSTSQSKPSHTRSKMLIRGQALEESCPPSETATAQAAGTVPVSSGDSVTSLTNDAAETNVSESDQSVASKDTLQVSNMTCNDSGLGTIDQADGLSDTSVASRDCSTDNGSFTYEYKDTSGVDIPEFMKETILKSTRDRKTILDIEEQLLHFINNTSISQLKMSEMTSYDRMIVHRLAAFLGLNHNVDSTGRCIVLTRTENTRSVKLSELVLLDSTKQDGAKKTILRKKPASFDDQHGRGSSKSHYRSHRTRSLEERQQNYIETRERIFKNGENLEEETVERKQIYPLTSAIHAATPQNSSYGQFVSSKTHTGKESASNDQHRQASAPHSVASHSPQQYDTVARPVDTVYNMSTASPNLPLMQPTVHPDGCLYQFDTSCPPPLLVPHPTRPPPTTPYSAHVQVDHSLSNQISMTDLAAKFAGSSLGPADLGTEHMGQSATVMSAVGPQPHPVYISPSPSAYPQVQYLSTTPSLTQQPVRYIAVPYPSHHQPAGILVDEQGHTTVPMPAVGAPGNGGGGSFQIVGGQPSMVTMGNPQHYVDVNSVSSQPVPDTALFSGAGLQNMYSPGAQHILVAYAHPYSASHPSQSQPNVISIQAPPTSHNGVMPQGSSYHSLPPPTPAHSLSQPPPLSNQQHYNQHQSQQPAVVFTPAVSGTWTYPVPLSHSLPATASVKPAPPTTLVPAPFTPHSLRHPQPAARPVVLSSSSGHHPPPAQVTLNYNQTVHFSPGQQMGTAAPQGSQLVAVQLNPYQVRPLGSTAFHLTGSPVVQTPQLATSNPHLQPYHWLLPVGPVSDVRLLNQGYPCSVQPSLHITDSNFQPTKLRSYNPSWQARKGTKKPGQVGESNTHGVKERSDTSQQAVTSTSNTLVLSSGSAVTHSVSSSVNRQ